MGCEGGKERVGQNRGVCSVPSCMALVRLKTCGWSHVALQPNPTTWRTPRSSCAVVLTAAPASRSGQDEVPIQRGGEHLQSKTFERDPIQSELPPDVMQDRPTSQADMTLLKSARSQPAKCAKN